jgi:hypothetical protein
MGESGWRTTGTGLKQISSPSSSLDCHSGAAQRSPESITTDDAEESVTLIALSEMSCLWIPGSTYGRPGMTAEMPIYNKMPGTMAGHEALL